MKNEYDFSNSVKNPYSQLLNTSKTISLEDDVILYFHWQKKPGFRIKN